MNKKSLLIIACSVISGVIAVLLVNFYIKGQEKSLFEGMELVSTIAVSEDVPAGTAIKAEFLAKRQVPSKYTHGNAVEPESVNLVIGQKLSFPLKRGDPLLWSDLDSEVARQRLLELASTITKGERALTIPVDQVSGVAGLLIPNDHIDILCTVRNQKTGEDATITLLQNLTVLAIGRQLASERDSSNKSYGSITLLVTLEEAELLVFAQKKGSIACVLRNPEDIDTSEEIPKVNFSNILKEDYRKKVQKKRNRIEIIKRGKTIK